MEQFSLKVLDLPLQDLMLQWPETISVFVHHKMLCIGCLIGPFHTVIDACKEYGLDVDCFYRELSECISQSP